MANQTNIDRFRGFAGDYDAVRPAPPSILVEVLSEIAEARRPSLVVDLGCGTGLSTRIWAESAERVIGIEPNQDMRHQAVLVGNAKNISYRQGTSSDTGLPNECADIITCVQALHWMEPESTFREVARCLRRGGVFAAADCDWPPLVQWELDEKWFFLQTEADRLVKERRLAPGLEHWDKLQHADRMRNSGRFRHVRELAFHLREHGDARRLTGLAKSQGGVATALNARIPEIEGLLRDFAKMAEQVLGADPAPWTFSYRVRVAVK